MNKFLFALILLLLGGCTLPHAPKGTTDDVRNDVMVVGVSENPPWVTRSADTPGGVEVELVQVLAQQMDADVEWESGTLTEHLEALHQLKLHLAAGDLIKGTPGSKEVGLTQPFFETSDVVGTLPRLVRQPR